MAKVLLALLPGLLVMGACYGIGVWLQWLLALATALAFERFNRTPSTAYLFNRPLLGDGSSLVSATLLALALPPSTPWWVICSTLLAALIVGKTLFGGAGHNRFNIAMLAYVLALVIFTPQLALWPEANAPVSATLGSIAGISSVDGISQATLLQQLKLNDRLTLDELFTSTQSFGWFAATASELTNLAFLVAGLWLIRQRVIDWQTPVAVLAGLFCASLVFYNGDGSDARGSPFFHLFSGATMLCAFFIATEPVTAAKQLKARWLIGLGVGVGIYLFRSFSSVADGVALSVLLANALTPALERHLRMRA